MPLKHFTETMLVIVLGVVTIVTGAILSLLPDLPDGFFPWAGLFAVTVLYPAALYPLLKRNRADYSFRGLHFAPVTMALGWLVIQVLILKVPRLHPLNAVYTWGWSAPAVLIVFLLIVSFCLQVIRRRVPRITALALLFTPFIAFAFVSEQQHWNTQLASVLWQNKGSTEIAAVMSSSLSASSRGEKQLSHSSIPSEEAWREKLRAVEEGKIHVEVASQSALMGIHSVLFLADPEGMMFFPPSSSSSSQGTRTIAHRRTELPGAGGECESLAILLGAVFLATLHLKAKQRELLA